MSIYRGWLDNNNDYNLQTPNVSDDISNHRHTFKLTYLPNQYLFNDIPLLAYHIKELKAI